VAPQLPFGPHLCNAFALTPGLPSSWPATLQPLCFGCEPKARVATYSELEKTENQKGRESEYKNVGVNHIK